MQRLSNESSANFDKREFPQHDLVHLHTDTFRGTPILNLKLKVNTHECVLLCPTCLLSSSLPISYVRTKTYVCDRCDAGGSSRIFILPLLLLRLG